MQKWRQLYEPGQHMSAGGYKFADFLRIGIPLTILMWAGFSLILPVLYQL